MDSIYLPPRHASVVDGIYVGNASAASDFDFLDQHDITIIINLTGRQLRDTHGKPIVMPGYIRVYEFILPSQELLDTEIPKTYNKLDAIMNAIRSSRIDGRNVLIQCNDGKNKSMLVAGYYLIVDYEQRYSNVVSKLEALYFTPQQKAAEARDTQSQVIPLNAAERITYETDKAERQELKGLTMMTFRKLLRLRSGETVANRHHLYH